VDDGGATVRRPALHLTGPVHLHDVRHDGEQRVGIGDGCREHRLCGLAEARLVGEQERAMTEADGLDEPRLVLHELETPRRQAVDSRRLGKVHAGRLAARADLERLEQRPEQLPVGETAHRHDGGRSLREVGRKERVRELPGAHGCRDHLVLGEFGLDLGLARDDELVGSELGTRLEQPVATESLGDRGDGGVGLEERDEARVARGGLREDLRDAVEPLEELDARGIRHLGIGLHACTLLAHEQRDDLELGAVRGAELALLRLRLDLAHLAREDRDDGCVIVARTRSLALPRLGHGPPVSVPPPKRPSPAPPSSPVPVVGARSGRVLSPIAVRRIPNRAARERDSHGRPKNGFVGRPFILAGDRSRRRAGRLRESRGRRSYRADGLESSYAAGMDDLAGAGVTPDDDEFTVAQDTEFEEDDLAFDDDERTIDDSLKDEVPGIDEERRVPLPDEPAAD
jgi:hypothetical protein